MTDTKVEKLQQLGAHLIEKDLAWGTSGNISVRENQEQYYITASGSRMESLQQNDIVLHPNLSDEKKTDNRKPSKEYRFHEAIYSERPDINAIIHSSPFYSTVLACSDIEIPSNYFIEAMYYLEKIEKVPYAHPGTEELANLIKEKAKKTNVFILENHGVIVADTSIEEALMGLQTLEFTAKMILTAKSSEIKLNEIEDNMVHDFFENARYKPKRNWSF